MPLSEPFVPTEPLLRAPELPAKRREQVLVCDDDVVGVGLLRHVLESQGFSMLTAFDGVQGLKVIDEQRPDLVILDINMPHKDGIGLLTDLKNMPGPLPRVIVLSNHEGKKMRDLCLSLGAQVVMSKPFSLIELIDKIGGILPLSGESSGGASAGERPASGEAVLGAVVGGNAFLAELPAQKDISAIDAGREIDERWF